MNKDIQALLNAIARRASPIFAFEKEKKPGFIEFAAAQAPLSKLFRYPGAGQPEPIVLGTRDGVTPDRRRSDDYRQYAGTPAPTRSYDQYAGTPEGQFKAIFQDRALGGYGDLSKAKGAPKDAQSMLELARQTTAPMGTDLNAYYAAQRGAGEIRKDQLVEYFGQRSQGLGEWAKANPALAYRQFMKESSRGGQMDAGTVAALETIGKAPVEGSIGNPTENFSKYMQGEGGYTPGAFGMPDKPAPLTKQPVGDQENRSTGDKVQSFLKALTKYGI